MIIQIYIYYILYEGILKQPNTPLALIIKIPTSKTDTKTHLPRKSIFALQHECSVTYSHLPAKIDARVSPPLPPFGARWVASHLRRSEDGGTQNFAYIT